MTTKNKIVSHTEVVKKAGYATFKKYGKKHYQEMAKKKWANEKARKIKTEKELKSLRKEVSKLKVARGKK
jgi:hypothetical protein